MFRDFWKLRTLSYKKINDFKSLAHANYCHTPVLLLSWNDRNTSCISGRRLRHTVHVVSPISKKWVSLSSYMVTRYVRWAGIQWCLLTWMTLANKPESKSVSILSLILPSFAMFVNPSLVRPLWHPLFISEKRDDKHAPRATFIGDQNRKHEKRGRKGDDEKDFPGRRERKGFPGEIFPGCVTRLTFFNLRPHDGSRTAYVTETFS